MNTPPKTTRKIGPQPKLLVCLAVAFATASLLIGAGCKKKEADPADATPGAVSVQTAPVEVRSMRTLLKVAGSFAPGQGTVANLSAPLPGRISKVFVKEGDSVIKGQLLATLDTSVSSAQSAGARAAAIAASASAQQAQLSAEAAATDQSTAVATARAGLNAAKAQGQSDITAAQVNYQSALSDLQKIEAGARPQELSQAHQAVLSAEADYGRAKQSLSRIQKLAQTGFASKKDLDDATSAAAISAANLKTAEQAESLVKAGARKEDRDAAIAREQGAKQALEAAKILANQRTIQAEAILSQAERGTALVGAKKEEALAALALQQQKQAEAGAAGATANLNEIRAPMSGKVTRRYLNPGDQADTATPILQVGTGSDPDFLARVPAIDAYKIAPGMVVCIRPDGADPSANFEPNGKVTSVSPADPATGLSLVRIKSNVMVIPGSGGSADVVLSTNPTAIAVPSEAIVSRDDKTLVFIDNGDTAKQVEVTLGGDDGKFTAIKSGLKAGEKVILLGQYEMSDGAKVKPVGPNTASSKDEGG